MPFVTAGFPSVAESRAALRVVAEHGDIIEVGVPFSDPLADGPTIQRSTFRALENGMSMAGTLELIASAEIDRPIVLFSYLNPALQYGIDRLLRDAAEVGVAGLLLTDLPVGTDPALETIVLGSPVALIRMVAPTSRKERIAEVVKRAQGFVYLVARLGVTGASTELATDLGQSIERVRAATSLPIAVGFGISTPAQAKAVARLADGVVVGSALVDELDRNGVAAAGRFLGSLRAALDSA